MGRGWPHGQLTAPVTRCPPRGGDSARNSENSPVPLRDGRVPSECALGLACGETVRLGRVPRPVPGGAVSAAASACRPAAPSPSMPTQVAEALPAPEMRPLPGLGLSQGSRWPVPGTAWACRCHARCPAWFGAWPGVPPPGALSPPGEARAIFTGRWLRCPSVKPAPRPAGRFSRLACRVLPLVT